MHGCNCFDLWLRQILYKFLLTHKAQQRLLNHHKQQLTEILHSKALLSYIDAVAYIDVQLAVVLRHEQPAQRFLQLDHSQPKQPLTFTA